LIKKNPVEKGKTRNQIRTQSGQASLKSPQKTSPKPRINSIKKKKKDSRPSRILGLGLILGSIYLLLAFSSYLISWTKDQSIVQNVRWNFIFPYSNYQVHNWMGLWGAMLSHFFIFKGFGIASFIFIFLFFLVGFRLLFKESLVHIGKAFAYSLAGLVYFSVGFGFFEQFRISSTLFSSGIFGYQTNIWLNASIGVAGTAVLLIFIGFTSFLIWFKWELHWPVRNDESKNQNEFSNNFEGINETLPEPSLLGKEDLKKYALDKNNILTPFTITEQEHTDITLFPGSTESGEEELNGPSFPNQKSRTQTVEKTNEKINHDPAFLRKNRKRKIIRRFSR
jgi:S-DNA-T family DNA segregation ATPase FtsK/SpoIIIE